jgi:putative colanic acid biosynthesis acetyltransferase WcaF
MSQVRLRDYDNSWYHPGRSAAWRAAWLFLGLPLLRASWITSSSFRVSLLRLFGARIGAGVVIKPGVNIKYPWHLQVGDDCWIGEFAWIDNLTTVQLGSNVCISQAAYLCTGNHDWSDPLFGLMIAPIRLLDGAWAGAKCILTPGVTLGQYAVAGAGSVVVGQVPDYQIYAGNPATFVKLRVIRDTAKSHPQATGPETAVPQTTGAAANEAAAP